MLPDDVWMQVFGWLRPEDLLRCERVCKDWLFMITQSSSLWRELYVNSVPKLSRQLLSVHRPLSGCRDSLLFWMRDCTIPLRFSSAPINLRSTTEVTGCIYRPGKKYYFYAPFFENQKKDEKERGCDAIGAFSVSDTDLVDGVSCIYDSTILTSVTNDDEGLSFRLLRGICGQNPDDRTCVPMLSSQPAFPIFQNLPDFRFLVRFKRAEQLTPAQILQLEKGDFRATVRELSCPRPRSSSSHLSAPTISRQLLPASHQSFAFSALHTWNFNVVEVHNVPVLTRLTQFNVAFEKLFPIVTHLLVVYPVHLFRFHAVVHVGADGQQTTSIPAVVKVDAAHSLLVLHFPDLVLNRRGLKVVADIEPSDSRSSPYSPLLFFCAIGQAIVQEYENSSHLVGQETPLPSDVLFIK
jgi:hypothetical protein